jgi:hypothetical protein
VDCRTWFWHAFFGTLGSCNDIAVLDRSPLVVDLMNGVAPRVTFEVNGNLYEMGYYLADGIYPDWQIFVKSIPAPEGEKRKYFAERQEGERKDVERGFCGLQVSYYLFIYFLFVIFYSLAKCFSLLYTTLTRLAFTY